VQDVEVQALDQHGRPAKQSLINITARHVILAAGAIGSPAVLLRSQAIDPHKQIGKRTFLHPVVGTAAIMSQIIDGFQGAPQSIYSDHFLWRDGIAGDLGYKLEVPPLHPSLTSSIVPGFGKSHRSVMKKYRHLQSIIALLRDGFHPEDVGGEVALDSNNLPVLDYPLREHFWDAALHSLEMMASIQFAAGAKVVIPVHQRGTPSRSMSDFKKQIAELPLRASQMGIFSAHVMGGCAMGADPESSVVRADGRAHHLENLSIMDGSVLPTSLGVNPQVTLYSLVRRNTHALIQHLVR
ncbi:MAG: GMC family oxidoreductase, partial [Enterobacterales bacterium]|nr:GMC family oxidoreductase [Enterobacterales bacterium]